MAYGLASPSMLCCMYVRCACLLQIMDSTFTLVTLCNREQIAVFHDVVVVILCCYM